MAPPPGSVMATEVEDWHTTAAWARVRPGMAATSIGQYVTMFHTESATRTATSVQVRSRTISQTSPKSAMRGRIPRKTAPTMTIEIPARTNRHVRRRRSTRADVARFSACLGAPSLPPACATTQG
jgi:hypothetical protein